MNRCLIEFLRFPTVETKAVSHCDYGDSDGKSCPCQEKFGNCRQEKILGGNYSYDVRRTFETGPVSHLVFRR
jgi:hypothetical protein